MEQSPPPAGFEAEEGSHRHPFLSIHRLLDWFPQVVKLSRARIHAQVHLLGLAILVGIVAGVGAIGFYIATRAVEHYALGVVGGYPSALTSVRL